MTRDDVERIIENTLRELTIDVTDGDWTNPNSRTVELKYQNRVISTAYFNVKERRDYEG
jgi:hypothetical protein